MNNQYSTIFFDWGGVIADDGGDDFLSQIVTGFGANETQVKQIMDRYWSDFVRGKLSEVAFWDALRTYYGFVIEDTVSAKFQQWPGLKANNDVLEVVDKLRSKGYKTAILSNIIEPCYKPLIASGLYSHFDAVIASCDIGYAKPESEIYNYALNSLNTVAKSSIFIDDRKWNTDRAQELGFTTILAESPGQFISDLKKLTAL